MSCVPIKLETEAEFTRQDENRLNHVFLQQPKERKIYQRTTCAKTIINLQQRLCHRVFKFFKRIFFPIEANPRSTSKRPLTTQNYADWRNRKNLDSIHLCLVNRVFFFVEYCLAINNWKSNIRVFYCWGTIRQRNGGAREQKGAITFSPVDKPESRAGYRRTDYLSGSQFSSRYRFSVFIIPVQEMTGLVVAAFKHLMLSASPG